MKKSAFLFIVSVLVLPVFAGSQTIDLIQRAPENCIVSIASSGLDNLADEIDQTLISQVLNDPQSSAFFNSILGAVNAQSGGQVMPVYQQALSIFNEIKTNKALSGPMSAGLVMTKFNQSSPPEGYVYFILDGGSEKLSQVNDLVELIISKTPLAGQLKPVQAEEAGIEVSQIAFGPGKFAWWQKDDYVLGVISVITSGSGPVSSLDKSAAIAKPLSDQMRKIKKYIDGSDDIIINYDPVVLMDKMYTAMEQNEDTSEQIDFLKSYSMTGSVVYRLGFEGKQFIADSITSINSITSYSYDIDINDFCNDLDLAMVNAVSEDMTGFIMCNLNLSSIVSFYEDMFAKFYGGQTGQGASVVDHFWQEGAQELGFDIKNDIVNNFTGEFILGWKLSALTGIAGSNFSLVLSTKDSGLILDRLDEHVLSELPDGDEFYLERDNKDGIEYRRFVIPKAVFWGVKPTLAFTKNQIIFSSSDVSAEEFAQRLHTRISDGTIARTEKYKAAVSNMPAKVKTLSYNNSEQFWKAVNFIAGGYYPLASMAVSQAGIVLPPTLPNYNHLTKDMPSYISWSEVNGSEIHTHMRSELGNELVMIGGTAMAVSILMPALSQGKAAANMTVNSSNFKTIGAGCVFYMDDNDDKMPESLSVLGKDYITDEYIKCVNCQNEYKYYGKGLDNSDLSDFIVCISDCQGANRGYAVLFMDGHVLNEISPEQMIEVIETDTKLRKEIGLESINLSEIRYTDDMSLYVYKQMNAIEQEAAIAPEF